LRLLILHYIIELIKTSDVFETSDVSIKSTQFCISLIYFYLANLSLFLKLNHKKLKRFFNFVGFFQF